MVICHLVPFQSSASVNLFEFLVYPPTAMQFVAVWQDRPGRPCWLAPVTDARLLTVNEVPSQAEAT